MRRARRAWGRLRDVARRPEAPVVALVVVAMLLPPWWASWSALHHGWWPDRDDAQIAMRTLDVLRGHLQYVGARSTSSLAGPQYSSHHPGPVEFYLLALPLALSRGLPVGIVVGTALLHTAALLWIARACWLIGRLRLLVPMALASLVLAYATGNGNLFRPLNTGPPTYYLLLLPLAAVVALSGRPWWMLVYAFGATVAMQGQLAYCPSVVALTALVLVLAVRDWRRRRGTWWPVPGHRPAGRGRPGWLTVLLLAALWALPVVESLTGDPGNATQLWRYLRADRQTPSDASTSEVGFLTHYLGWPVPLPLPDALRALLTVVLLVGVALLARSDVRGLRARGQQGQARVVGRLSLLTVVSVPLEVACLYLLLPPSTSVPTPAYWLTPMVAAGASLWAVGGWLTARRVQRAAHLPAALSATVSALGRPRSLASLVCGLGTLVVAVVVCLTNVRYDMAENHVLTQAADLGQRGVASGLDAGTTVRVASGGTSAFVNPVAGTSYRLMRTGVFACADLPWPLPESTDYRTWSACPATSPVVVAVLDDRTETRPHLDGRWERLGRTSSYVSPGGETRWFEVYLVRPRNG